MKMNFDGILPSYYTQYVDNFSFLNVHGEAKWLFSYLNSRHPNAKFAMETEVNLLMIVPIF